MGVVVEEGRLQTGQRDDREEKLEGKGSGRGGEGKYSEDDRPALH